MGFDAAVLRGLQKGLAQFLRERIGHGLMPDIARGEVIEIGAFAAARDVDKLIRHHKSARAVFFLQGTAAGRGHHMGAPRLLQRVEIGAEIDPVRRNGVLKAVPREQYDTRVTAPETANAQGARRAAVRCARRKFLLRRKEGRVVQACASDYANKLAHIFCPYFPVVSVFVSSPEEPVPAS